MKRIATVLFALVAAVSLLAASVPAAVVDSSPVARKPMMHKKACCKNTTPCPTRCCVERRQSTPAENPPAVPASNLTHQLQLGLMPDFADVFQNGSSAINPVELTPAFAPRCSAVPLYVRTHSFLI